MLAHTGEHGNGAISALHFHFNVHAPNYVKDCVALRLPPFSWNEITKLWLRALGCGAFSVVLLTTEHEHANNIRSEH